ncbi:MAG: alkaline phosphatase D family protein [Planctomycetota bacterium]|nr:alkaline phosphatase D family protein [Planctomycetota bacterium]MDG1982930.1 alkaline phosphatase D family protein [Planctomycetota bacterium]
METRRRAFTWPLLLLMGASSSAAQEPVSAADPEPVLGPVLGDLRPDRAKVWVRLGVGRTAQQTLFEGGAPRSRGRLAPRPDADGTAVLELERLEPGVDYRVLLEVDGQPDLEVAFTTPGPHAEVTTARVAFGSCASHDRFESQPIWTAMAEAAPDALVLLGDTPYIDSTELARQRRRYREFWSIPELRPLAASVPVYATWDDHDFATNDQVGDQPGRERSRQAFIEYHPQPSFGDGEGGIYTSFRRGPVEVFLVDTRWFGDEEALGAPDSEHMSLLGAIQREQLIAAVSASGAAVKVLACGMVWNGAVRPGKRDCWWTWRHERDAIFAALGAAKVKGVVLVGGDVHRPRIIRHESAVEHLGYPPVEFVSSPLANHAIASAAEPHPGLVWDASADSVALVFEVELLGEVPKVTGRMIGPKGEVLRNHEVDPKDLGY